MKPGNWIFKGAFSNKIHDISFSGLGAGFYEWGFAYKVVRQTSKGL